MTLSDEQMNLAEGAGLIVRLYDAASAVVDDSNRFGAKGSFHYSRAPREALMARLADAVQAFESHGVVPTVTTTQPHFDHLAAGEALRASLRQPIIDDSGDCESDQLPQEALTQECDQCGRRYPESWSAGCFNAEGDDDCDGTIRPTEIKE